MMSHRGREHPITPSASFATPRTRWSPRSDGRANTASISSRWRTAARVNRRCWPKRKSPRWWRRRIGVTCASESIRAAPDLRAPPPKPAPIGSFTPNGELHAKELEIFVKYAGYTPMEAIVAATRDNAYAVGLEGQVGELAPGKLADLIVLNKDPVSDITVLQGGKHVCWVIKDGKIVDLDRPDEALTFQQAAEEGAPRRVDRKSTRLNSSHTVISYAVFCLKKKNEHP